jgi:competence protein ComEC
MQSWMIGTVAAVFAMGWMPSLPAPLLLLCGLVVALPVLRYSRGRWRYLLAGLLSGALWGCTWGYTLLAERVPAVIEGELIQAQGLILEPPQLRSFSRGGQRQRFSFQIDRLSCRADLTQCPQRLGKVLLSYYGDAHLRAGQRWQFTLRLKQPWGLANPGSFNFQSWLAQHRFAATGYVREKDAELLSLPLWWHSPLQQWRQRIVDTLQAHFADRPSFGVLKALSLGDRSGINADQWALFQQFGLNHLVVISGLHVGMVAALGFLLGRVFGLRSAHVAAALLALVYSAQAGFALPTVRALVMLFIVQLGALLRRKPKPLRSLVMALTVIALIDPLASHSAGFWLSFSAVALIFYLHAMWPGLRGWRLALCMQLCLSLYLGLLASFWFGGLGWLSPAANLIAIPVLTFWMAPLCLFASLMTLIAPLLPVCHQLALWAWQLAAVPVEAFLHGAVYLEQAALPLWLDYHASLGATLALLLALLLLAAHRAVPLRWLALLLLLLPVFPHRPALTEGELQVTALDIGQGLAVIVRNRDAVVLYDTGAGDPDGPNMATSVIVPYLRELGIEKLDLLVISHADRDHASGVYSLHDRLEVAQTWYGDQPFNKLEGQQACRPGLIFARGKLHISVLHPADSLRESYSSNNRSCVLRVEHSGFAVLLPGDVEADVERLLVRNQATKLSAQVLVAAHHGSQTSSSGPFLRAVDPRWTIFSRGYRNRFGHPHASVLRRMGTMDIEILDTARDGAVSLRVIDGQLVNIERQRVTQRYYWY